MRPTTILLATVAATCSGDLCAQVRPGDMGWRVQTKAGTVGNLCHGFACKPIPLTVSRGETVLIELRGPKGFPYWVFFSPRAPQPGFCLPITGFKNRLVAPAPVFLGWAATLSQQDRFRVCPGGLHQVALTVPKALALGQRLTFQALIVTNWVSKAWPTFAPALDVTVK